MNYVVKAAAAVVRLKSGGERYLYQGAQFSGDEANAEHLEHLVNLKLVEPEAVEAVEAKPTRRTAAN